MKKKTIFLNLIILLLFITPSIKALGYQIDSYNVDIVVNKNNTFDITETIDVYFDTYKHGIIRKIPLRNKVERLDGVVTNNRAKLSNISVDSEFSKYKENGYYIIKIGSSSETLTGKQRYVIKYNYNIGKDPLKDKDEFYFNIIGTEWDTTISNVSFKITMPESFSSNKLKFSSGKYGSIGNKVAYSVDGNVIIGKYNGTLGVGEGFTVMLELPEGYFAGVDSINIFLIILYLLVSLFLVISLLLLKKSEFGKKRTISLTSYPPENLDVLDIDYLYDGKLDSYSVELLIISLANKGYLKIKENSTGIFKIIKVREYDGTNENEKIILNELFKDSHSQELNNYELKSKLCNEKIISKRFASMNGKVFKKTLFEKISIYFMMFITYIVMYLPLIIDNDTVSMEAMVFIMIYSLFPTAGILLCLLPKRVRKRRGLETSLRMFILIVLIVANLPFFIIVLPTLLSDLSYLFLFVEGMVIIYILLICYIYCVSGRTEYGEEMLLKISGFKKFIETATKEQLETQIRNNPNYFYDILPFSYIFNISNEWINKFKDIPMQLPTWYISSDNENN